MDIGVVHGAVNLYPLHDFHPTSYIRGFSRSPMNSCSDAPRTFPGTGGGESLRGRCMLTLDGGLMPRGWVHAER